MLDKFVDFFKRKKTEVKKERKNLPKIDFTNKQSFETPTVEDVENLLLEYIDRGLPIEVKYSKNEDTIVVVINGEVAADLIDFELVGIGFDKPIKEEIQEYMDNRYTDLVLPMANRLKRYGYNIQVSNKVINLIHMYFYHIIRIKIK